MLQKKKKMLDSAHIARLTETLALPIAEANNCQIVDVEFIKEAGEWILRVFIERDTPVDHDCCQAVSEGLGQLLDLHDPIPVSYILEVSSPGIERPLKKEADFLRFAGEKVAIHLFAPQGGKKEYQGILLGLEDNRIILEINGNKLTFAKNDVAKAHLAIDFNKY
ncbi:MAG: ribosome maturation factor RimP [Clostridiales bacterium]|nr:ribosome maturation factor RimP [Clostridiales bacterium]